MFTANRGRLALGRWVLPLLVILAGCAAPVPPSGLSSTPPRALLVSIIDAGTGAPIGGARVAVGSADPVRTDEDGRVSVQAVVGAPVEASASDHDIAMGTVPGVGDLTISMRFNVVSGMVTGGAGEPLPGVRVFVDGAADFVTTDDAGAYRLLGVPASGTLVYKVPGHRLGLIPIDESMMKDVSLPAFTARGLYAPASVFERSGRLDEMLALADRTEVNAMVIDVKEASGKLYWATDLPAARATGSIMAHPLLQLETLLPQLKQRGVYTIARMVVMKDNTLGTAHPELAVRNTATGEPWRDGGGAIWLDPFSPGVAEYIAALAVDLADKGFDEVQLDYVRFYSDGDYARAATSLPNTGSFRLPAMRRFFRVVSDALATKRAFLGADVFPISFIASDDQGIGQRPEVIMPYVDYFSPMVYPSHYAKGTFGFAVPNDHPYEVIDRTLRIMNAERAGLRMVIRPWIQDFGLGDMAPYSAAQVQAEMKATRDDAARGWMIWNARANFTVSALGGPLDGEESTPVTVAIQGGS